MIELFEFHVAKPLESAFSYEDDRRFINFLEPRRLYWGGGGNRYELSGVISTKSTVNLQALLEDFIGFFEQTDQIVIRLISDPQLVSSTLFEHFGNVTFEPYQDV